jgi:hypothetical protein
MKGAVHRSLALSVCLLAVGLLGETSLLVSTPSIVVYPLIANGTGVNSETGARISVTIASQIAQQGGISVKNAPPGIEQRDYLVTARQLGVDFYLTGYVTPLGAEASLVEQLVSAKSGSVVWSNTALLTTYGEAAGQASIIRSAILAYAGRAISTLQPIDTSTPRPPPAPDRLPPPKKVAVLALSGDDAPDRVQYATASILKALAKNKVAAARSPDAAQDPGQSAGSICRQTGATLLLGATLSTQSTNATSATANVIVTGYDCSGAQVGRQTASSSGDGKRAWQVAIDRAVDAAVLNYLQSRTGS